MQTPNLEALAKLFGVRNPIKPGTSRKPLIPPKPRKNETGTRQEGIQNAIMDARDKQAYFAKRAKEREEARFVSLYTRHAGIRRYFKTLAKIEPDCECIGYLDCDVDLRALAEECGIDRIEDSSERFLLYSRTHEWVIGLAKRRGQTREQYFASADPFSPETSDLAMIDLKHALRLH